LAGIIGQAACDTQSGKSTALIGFDMKDAQAFAPSGPRAAGAQSSGGLPLTTTRALVVLA
jgi:hypothetical protein